MRASIAAVALSAMVIVAAPAGAQDAGPPVDRSAAPDRSRAERAAARRAAAERAAAERAAAEDAPGAAEPTAVEAGDATAGPADPAPVPPAQALGDPDDAAPTPPEVPNGDAGVILDLDGGVPRPPPALPADAGPPDAGAEAAPDAGAVAVAPPPPPAPPPAEDEDDEWLGVVRELLFDRAEREARQDEPPPGPIRERRVTPVRVVEPVSVAFGLELPERTMSTFGLVFLTALALLGLFVLERLRRRLPREGVLPRILGLAHIALRVAAAVMLVMVVSRLLPMWLRPYLFLALAAAAVAVGFGAVWTVLPDVMGGVILLAERRVRPGLWLTSGELRGAVERVGVRVTVLRAPDGSRVTVPNRLLLKNATQTTRRRWHDVDVELSVKAGRPAAEARRAIADAVLCSPYVPSDPAMLISRDPTEPTRWRVRARILDAGFAASFEGELLERVEETLAAATDAGDAGDAAAADADGEESSTDA